MPTATELPITTLDSGTVDATDLANEIFGAGVTNVSATYSGDLRSAGIYTNGDTVSPDATPGDTGVILSTGLAEDFTNSDGSTNTNQNTNTSTNTSGVNNDADFNALAGAPTRDASFLEINFTPAGDFITVDFVIASEEYPEFVNSQYLDVVGVWVNGVEATVSIGDGTASVGNINDADTPNLYNDNTGDAFNTEMDGFTITLTFVAPVNPGVNNVMKIGVADVADPNYDTNLLIAGGSVQSTIVAQDDTLSLGNNDTKIIDVLDNDSSTGGTLFITHINGVAVNDNDTVILATGQEITLNPDDTLTVKGDSDAETVYFTYSIEDAAGNTDTALVEVTQVPCFASGVEIDTPDGPCPVERLAPGDLVLTRDNGPMAIRWIGCSEVPVTGGNRPVRIAAGTFGAKADVVVSPNHRILLSDQWAELLFSAHEVLVKAKDLVNHRTVTWDGQHSHIRYFHILLDDHQLLTSHGLVSESYHLGSQTMHSLDRETLAEIFHLFPDLAHDSNSYGPAARPSLRRHEAMLLRELAG